MYMGIQVRRKFQPLITYNNFKIENNFTREVLIKFVSQRMLGVNKYTNFGHNFDFSLMKRKIKTKN